MDAAAQSPPETPRLRLPPQQSDLGHQDSVSDSIFPDQSHKSPSDPHADESSTTVESDSEPVEVTVTSFGTSKPVSQPADVDKEIFPVDLDSMPANTVRETLGPVDSDSNENFPTDTLKEMFATVESESEPAGADKEMLPPMRSDSEPADVKTGRGLDDSAMETFTSSESDSELVENVDQMSPSPEMDTVEEILPSIESDPESTEAELGRAQRLCSPTSFASELQILENCVEECGWTQDQIIPRLPDHVVWEHLLKMTRLAHSALQSFPEADFAQDLAVVGSEDDCQNTSGRLQQSMVGKLHALLSQVLSTYDAHVSTWSERNYDDDLANPSATRAATVDAEDEEMSFAMDMLQKHLELGSENEKLERKISSLEWANHNLQKRDEEARLELETLTREMKSCSPSRKTERESQEPCAHGREGLGLWPSVCLPEEADLSPADDKSPAPPSSSSSGSPEVKWRTSTQGISPEPGSSKRTDWRRKFWSEQTRALAAERSQDECEKELEDMRWEVKGLQRDLKASQLKEEQLEQRLKQRQPQEETEERQAVQWNPEPRTLFSELGSLTSSPRLGFESRPSCTGHDVVRLRRPMVSPAHIASGLAKEEYTAWRDVFLFVSFVVQWVHWLLVCFVFQGLLSLPLLRRMPGKKNWTRPEASFQADGLIRALRQVMLLLALHTYLACRTEREMWLVANGQTARYLRREMRYGRPSWFVPGVDPSVLWDRMNELFAPVMAQTMDVWVPLIVSWWRGKLAGYE
ncbi:hypothetical protein XA68_12671 [Ophiocordyceps unilateralis]|uniref:Uncharacterized protein n=1 Tax=Ophiocordyceps unilateralis TaxID=268505 RepID=A0A2A9PE59_OPHUN|nr:hypothetical protein XA68_12671 [Ophiocordyceps unilateralis]